jgi:hypothetical protein
MAFELPHFGREQSEADGATPVSPVDAVDQQREPLMALLRASRPPSGGVAQKRGGSDPLGELLDSIKEESAPQTLAATSG